MTAVRNAHLSQATGEGAGGEKRTENMQALRKCIEQSPAAHNCKSIPRNGGFLAAGDPRNATRNGTKVGISLFMPGGYMRNECRVNLYPLAGACAMRLHLINLSTNQRVNERTQYPIDIYVYAIVLCPP